MSTFMEQVRADLTFADIDAHTHRTPGLSMSGLGGCQRRAAFNLTGAAETDTQDKWTAMRGTALHTFILNARRAARRTAIIPEFDLVACPPLVLPGLPEIPGTPDEVGEDSVTDYKSCEPDRAHWHALHGPDDGHAMQVVGYAHAWDKSKARVVYVPTTGTFDDWVVCELDVDVWLPRVADWLATVVDGVEQGVDLPRGEPYDWCKSYCPFFTDCRGDDEPYEREPIIDPTIVAAAAEYLAAHQDYTSADKRKKAAKVWLTGIRGDAAGIIVGQQRKQYAAKPDMARIAADYQAAGHEVPMGAPNVGYSLTVKAART